MLIVIILIIVGLHQCHSYDLKCPETQHFKHRAAKCQNPQQYLCLINPLDDLYNETCTGPDRNPPGTKVVFQPLLHKANCTKSKYQPIIFETWMNSDCIFQKSTCAEEGQVVYSTGSTIADVSCTCDYTRGYTFVSPPMNKCYCVPSEEDCSCYMPGCKVSQDHYCEDSTTRHRNSEPLCESINKDHDDVHVKDIIPTSQVAKVAVLLIIGILTCILYLCVKKEDKNDKAYPLNQRCSIDPLKRQPASIQLHQVSLESSVQENIGQELKEWEEEDNKTFIQTKASETIFKTFQTNNCVTITGSAGVGKTATLRHVAVKMKKSGYNVFPITDPCYVDILYRQNCKTVFVIDDFCGIYSINNTYVDKWKTYNDKIAKIVEKNSSAKFLIACRLQVYQDELFKSLFLFQRYECNLLSDELRLSNEEKVSLANFYLKEEAEEIISYLDTLDACFPLLCKMYSLKPKLKINIFFKTPYPVYESEIDKLCSEGHYPKYCALALIVMFNNHFKEEWLATEDKDDIDKDIRDVIENTCEACNVNRGIPRRQLLNEMSSLESMFIKKENCVFKAFHDRIFDMMTFYFGKKIPTTLIKNANSGLIKERFLLDYTDIDINTEFVIRIPSRNRDIYFRKLILVWSSGKLQDVFSNINMKSQNFRWAFLSFIQKQDTSKQKSLATMKDSQNDDGVILQCCFIGDLNIIQWCIKNKGKVNACRNDMSSPLFIACQEGHSKIVKILLDNKADVNKLTNTGASPLLMACEHGDTEIVKTLLENKADINRSTDEGLSPLYIACEEGHTEIVKILLNQKADINNCLYKGALPLHIACERGHTEIVKILLDYKANVNKCKDDETSPLYLACQEGHLEITKILLKNKSDINKCTDNNISPLYIASEEGHKDIVKILLDNNADVFKCRNQGDSPLNIAAKNNHLLITEMLKSRGAV